jgi:hypothetical protein
VRRRLTGLFVVGLALFLHASLAPAAVIQVTIERASGAGPVEVGQSVTVNVLGRVNQPASPNDGIFTFDQDLVIANSLPGPNVVQPLTVSRPAADDTPLGGSNGQVTPAGIHAIYGGYLDTTQGVNSPVLLFSANLLAAAPGTVTLTPGPAVDPYGFDFVLYQSQNPTVLYGSGLELTVVPATVNTVPLPAAALPGTLVGVWIVVKRTARRHRRTC